MSTEQNKAILRRLIEEGVNQGNLGLVDELVAPDFVNHNPLPGGSNDREGLRQGGAALLQALPDLHNSIEALIAEADLVVVRGIVRGTHQGALMGIPPSGKPVAMRFIGIFRIRDGKIVERWEEGDILGLLQQIGAIPQTAPS